MMMDDHIIFECSSCSYTRSVSKTNFPEGGNSFVVTCPKCRKKSPLNLPVDKTQDEEVSADAENELTEAEAVQLYQQIAKMGVADKIKLAVSGPKEAREILVNDSNKMVAAAVLKSPKITESEIEAISKSRSICEDVLRLIASNKEWMSSDRIKFNLASNTKTPVSVVLAILPSLTEPDLRKIATDSKVDPQVAAQARRQLDARGQP